MSERTPVDFWFDPSCPWAWMTSRWIGEVEKQRDIDVTWHIMSLWLLNKDREELPDSYKSFLPRAMRYARVVNAAFIEHGQDAVKPLYDALGTRIHPQGRAEEVDAVIAEALAEAGLPAELAKYADLDTYDVQLQASHDDGIGRVGQDVGTPVIALSDYAFFGPVISPAPKGEEAAKLWDGVVAVAAYPGFFEIKRSRTVGPIFD